MAGSYESKRENPQVTLGESLWDKRDTAKYLGVSVKTIDRWIAESRGPAGRKVGVQVRYRPADVQTYLESCATVGGARGETVRRQGHGAKDAGGSELTPNDRAAAVVETPRCACRTGYTPDGGFCACELGKDLATAERRAANKAAANDAVRAQGMRRNDSRAVSWAVRAQTGDGTFPKGKP
jgi:excisionase family DNA binding protein